MQIGYSCRNIHALALLEITFTPTAPFSRLQSCTWSYIQFQAWCEILETETSWRWLVKSWGLWREVKANVNLETLPCEVCMFTPWLWGLPRRGPFSRCLCQRQTSGTTQEMSSVLTLLLSFTHFPADLELWQPFWGLCWTTYRKEVWHGTGWISGYQAKTANGCINTYASCQ